MQTVQFSWIILFSNFSSIWPHILLWRMAYRENPHSFLSHEWKVVSSSPTPLVSCSPSSQILMIFLPFKERYFFCLQSMLAETLSWGTLNIYFWNGHKYLLIYKSQSQKWTNFWFYQKIKHEMLFYVGMVWNWIGIFAIVMLHHNWCLCLIIWYDLEIWTFLRTKYCEFLW